MSLWPLEALSNVPTTSNLRCTDLCPLSEAQTFIPPPPFSDLPPLYILPPPPPPPPSPSFHRSRSSTTFSLYPSVFVGLEPSPPPPPPTRILCPRAPPDFSEWGAWLVSLSLFIQVAQQVEETCCCSGPVWNQGFVQDLTCYCSVYSSDLLTTADLYITPFETFVLIQVCVT